MTKSNVQKAVNLLAQEIGESVADEDLEEYLAAVGEVSVTVKAIRQSHSKAVARLASQKSRAKRAERLAELEARIAELETPA